jgi:diacylglycerol kinase (ATP)
VTGRRLLAILNPISGSGRARMLEPELERMAQAAGIGIQVVCTEAAGHARELAAGARAQGYDAVASVGGDGTINEVINGLGPGGLPLLVVPQGTGNVLAKEIRATARVMRYVPVLREWRTATRDLGRLGDGRLFACFVGAGFDGRCTRALAERTAGMRMSQYVPIMWRAVRESDYRTLRLKADGVEASGLSYVLVSITPEYGGPLALTAEADPADGRFEVLTVERRITPLSLVELLAHGFVRRMRSARGTRFLSATSIELSADEAVPIQVDGDYAGHLPLSCRILPAALTYFQ